MNNVINIKAFYQLYASLFLQLGVCIRERFT